MKRTLISAMFICTTAAFLATGCASNAKPAETTAATVAESTEKAEETTAAKATEAESTEATIGGADGPTEIIVGSDDQAAGSEEISDEEYYVANPVPHFGTILSVDAESGDISINVVRTTDSGDTEQEVIFHSISSVPIVDAMTGLPLNITELAEGQTVYAWSNQAMTMSIPAQTSLQALVVNVPEDAGTPTYVVAAEAEYDEASGSLSITDQDGNKYTAIDGEADIQPFKTRNIVTLQDVTVGSRMMIWDNVTKIVLF